MERTTPVTAAVDLGTGNADAASLPPAADSMVTDDVGKRVAETPPDSSLVPKKARVAPRAEGSAARPIAIRRPGVYCSTTLFIKRPLGQTETHTLTVTAESGDRLPPP